MSEPPACPLRHVAPGPGDSELKEAPWLQVWAQSEGTTPIREMACSYWRRVVSRIGLPTWDGSFWNAILELGTMDPVQHQEVVPSPGSRGLKLSARAVVGYFGVYMHVARAAYTIVTDTV